MQRWTGRVSLITGASCGIGRAISIALVENGVNVIGCGRDIDRLNELAANIKGPGTFTPVKCDITKEQEIIDMFEMAKSKFGGIDICVNNAGLNHNTTLVDGKTEDWKNILDVNVLGLSICSREAVKSMKEKGANDGYIINIGSTLGHFIVPNYPPSHMYSASKYAVRALTEGIKCEVRATGTNIRVTHISPGVVQTELPVRMMGPEYAKKLYSSLQPLQPEDIADAALYVLSTPPHVEVTELSLTTTDVVKR